MGSVKTAISIEKDLFDQVEKMARSMKISRSRLFVIALRGFIEHQKSKELLALIDAAYADEPDEAEQALRRKARRLHRRMVEGEW